MAVGTGNITLQEVCIELYGAVIAGQSLAQCFIDAEAAVVGSFDPIYEGNKDRLSNFKGYSSDALPAQISTLFRVDCSYSGTMVDVYFDASTNIGLPAAGDILYENAALTIPFNGAGRDDYFLNVSELSESQLCGVAADGTVLLPILIC